MKLLLAGSAVVALSLLTAGCSGGSGSTAAVSATAGATSATGAVAATPASSAASGAKSAPLAVCTTLPTAQAASLSGRALTSSREQDFAGNNSYTCGYLTASGVGGLSVTVSTMGGKTAYANTLSTDTIGMPAEHVTPLTGVGDKAFSARDGVHVLFGDRMISIAGLTSVPAAEAIVQAVQARLGQ